MSSFAAALDTTYAAKSAAGLLARSERRPAVRLFWSTKSSAPLPVVLPVDEADEEEPEDEEIIQDDLSPEELAAKKKEDKRKKRVILLIKAEYRRLTDGITSKKGRVLLKKLDLTGSPIISTAAEYALVESYLALGIPEEAKKAAAVLGANYPGTKWYEQAYKLIREHAPNA